MSVYIYRCVYIYIYIERERERERETYSFCEVCGAMFTEVARLVPGTVYMAHFQLDSFLIGLVSDWARF